MKIAVIGATGATGRKVMERALELGHEVVAVARRPEVITPAERLSTRQGDVFDASSMAKAIAGTDVVISCIGPTKNFSPGTFMSQESRISLRQTSRRVPSCRRESRISLWPVSVLELSA